MNDDRMDLSPLDPTVDPARFERLVGAIHLRARPAIVGRRHLGVVEGIAGWWTPALAAAALIAAVSLAALATVTPTTAQPQLAESVGVPSSVVDWMQSGSTPTPAELLAADGGSQ